MAQPRRNVRWLRRARNALVGAVVVALAAAITPLPSEAAAVPGSAGVDTSLPATDSQVTVKGRGAYADLELTINQTRNLTSQAVSLSWTGGVPTVQGAARFEANFLQVMQCWGDDDGSNAENPGPPPEQCVAGATDGVPEGGSGNLFAAGGDAVSRVISRRQFPSFDPSLGTYDERTGWVWRPFRSVDGSEIGVHTDPEFNPTISGGNYWLNSYFDVVTTNEVAGARTGPDGTGQELVQVNTGVESSGLGCGQRITLADGSLRTPKCWLVVVPRGSAATENVGTGFQDNAGVMTSPLAPGPWSNRIAIPLEFNPVDSSCDISEDDRRIVGSELAVPALSSWQPALCESDDLPPFTFGTVADAAARQQIAEGGAGAAGMALTSQPLRDTQTDPASPVVYAPVTLSGAVIAFNVERIPALTAGPEEEALRGIRVGKMNLTPRLVAKLLTQSYSFQVSVNGAAPPHEWLRSNPRHLGEDQEFLKFNPEFTLLEVRQWRNFGGLVLPARNSDLALQLWSYVLADPEARAWLDGASDEWGMRVNPVYATTAEGNVNGAAFADPTPDSFPKADPTCFQGEPLANGTAVPALCGTDWLPYVQGLNEAAVFTRVGDDRAKVSLNPFAQTPDQVWKRGIPQPLGERAILSITDSASAARYGLQVARLSRPGDEGDERQFVAPGAEGFGAGVAAMRPGSEPAVLVPDFSQQSDGAYPLTMLTYASIKPLDLDAEARSHYAGFLDYVTAAGQVSGIEPGELPNGYTPLPAALKAQAAEAADLIRSMQAPPVTIPAESGPPSPTSTGVPLSSPSPINSDRSAVTTTTSPEVVDVVLAAAPEEVASTPEAGPLTPILALARNRYFLLALAILALGSTVMALEITKRPRRRVGPPPESPS